ncbi:MAG: lipocalin family protein [Prevotella sp.]|jgi:hypothetical protein|nr:lipocalin family protein [Prevotella sp.]
MKRLFFLSVASATMMLLSCGGNKQQAQGEETPETTEKENVILRDRTIYGICTDGTAMNTLEMTTDNGDTLTLSLTKAQEDGKVFGGLQVTDRVAVVADSARQNALLVINLNTLMGDWVMPDPIDGSAEIGIRIKEGGVAESIDQSVIVYRTWKIFNGELEIELMREGGGDEEELNRYEILTLSADTLAYRTLGKPRDETETFEYSRWKPKPKVDLHGLELEETSDEFNKI